MDSGRSGGRNKMEEQQPGLTRDTIDPHREIDFKTIDHLQFEELCYELVEAAGFRSLEWRRGGADSGRDIQGTLTVSTGLFSEFEELWFFECKHHAKGVGPELLASKFIHALAENPRHLVFFISSFPTTGAKRWIKEISARSAFKIHIVDGEHLRAVLRNHPGIVEKFFSSKLQTVAAAARRSWQLQGLVPATSSLIRFAQDVELSSAAAIDKALLFIWTRRLYNDFEAEDDVWRPMISMMAELENSSEKLWPSCRRVRFWETKDNNYGHSFVAAEVELTIRGVTMLGTYCFERHDGVGIEVFVAQKTLQLFVRYVETGADQEVDQVLQKFFSDNSSSPEPALSSTVSRANER
ncbi:restriction endonuclease [Rhizobium leguminosarum]|uniref:restriction endonuclease n=1 Tax=Rhizobium leguminosarum TaxID=384 RepID=UPI00144126C4|nr:restriction endonuclease [Rhizobium leguminosarum]NKM00939.1 hypothetical protein [Rhizobium leguminosarum bv. viciae]